MRNTLWFVAFAPCLALISAGPAAAHPMGNFTISHYSELTAAPGELRVRYVLDMAEIPTIQERQWMDADSDGTVTPAESDAYLETAKRRLPAGLSLRVDGAPRPLTLRTAELSFPLGEGNLPTLKLHLRLSAPLPAGAGPVTLEYADTNYAERAGWKELVVNAAPGARILEADAPAAGVSRVLAAYPDDLLNAPPQQTQARAVVAFDGAVPASTAGATAHSAGDDALPAAARAFPGEPSGKRAAGRLAELLTAERLSWPVLLLSLLVAFGLGAAHALEPGHGKTVVAAYLVGSRGTPKHALWLGLIVTLSHTVGVFALGLVTLFASAYVLPERLYPWIGALSGLAITAVGLSLLRQHARHAYAHAHNLPHEHGHAHGHQHSHREHGHRRSHGGHVHSHSHPHGHHSHEHTHHHEEACHGSAAESHLLPECARQSASLGEAEAGATRGRKTRTGVRTPAIAATHSGTRNAHADHGHHHHDYGEAFTEDGIRFRSLLTLGISGGIVPCPGALVVLLGAIALQRVGFGLALIVAFSLGLAAVLTGIGLLTVSARGLLDRFPALSDGRWSLRLAVASALAVSLLGLGIAARSLAAAGLIQLPV